MLFLPAKVSAKAEFRLTQVIGNSIFAAEADLLKEDLESSSLMFRRLTTAGYLFCLETSILSLNGFLQ